MSHQLLLQIIYSNLAIGPLPSAEITTERGHMYSHVEFLGCIELKLDIKTLT